MRFTVPFNVKGHSIFKLDTVTVHFRSVDGMTFIFILFFLYLYNSFLSIKLTFVDTEV